MNSNTLFPKQYINTPFAYTKLSKNLSLLQQSMLNKVSEHLQGYVQKYFGSDLCKSRDIPRPLFTEAEKNNGMPDFVISYAELGVSINNYQVARAAVKEVLELTVDAPGVDKDGNPAIIAYNIFTKANLSSKEGNGVVFSLNPEVVDYVFDMSQGYVRHPADIARLGRVERMPMMYYYLFKVSERWKNREVHLTVIEIKDYLGMRVKTKASSGENEIEKKRAGRPLKAGEIKEAYPKFSQFKKMVLDTSINDINRLRKEGLLDICVSYEPVYNGKRKVGNPAFIKFHIFDTIEEMEKANAQQQQMILFEVNETGLEKWKAFVSHLVKLRSPIADFFLPLSFYSFDGASLVLSATAQQRDLVERNLTDENIQAVKESMNAVFGKIVNLGYKVAT